MKLKIQKVKDMKKNIIVLLATLPVIALQANAQQVLTLDECKQMAVDNSNSLKTAEQKVKIADYDRKIAAANFFPKITATGTYMYNTEDIKLISDETSQQLTNAGTALQTELTDKMTAILSDPDIFAKVVSDPALQKDRKSVV